MTKGWVRIYRSSDFFKSEIVRQVLIDHEIEAVLLDKQGFPYKFGDVEVYIHEANFQKAIEIIISNQL